MQGRDHIPGADDGTARPPQGARMWVHPSEIGLRRRVCADRRRSRRLALGVVVSGAALLLASTRFPGETAPHRVHSSASPMSEGVVGVEPLDPGAAMTTGLVLDGLGHILVPLSALGPDPQTRVHCGEGIYDATTVAEDPSTGLAVVEVDSPRAVAPLPTATVAVGDGLTLTSVGADGQRRATQVQVTEVGAGTDAGGTPTAFLASGAQGAVDERGVLSTADGRLAGWVVSGHPRAEDGAVVALAAGPLLARATELTAGAPGAGGIPEGSSSAPS